jgi:hypothetical protein
MAASKTTNEINVKSWEECEREIRKIEEANRSSIQGVWFRGQGDAAWPLESTLERRTKNSPFSVAAYYHLMFRIRPAVETFTGSSWQMDGLKEVDEWARTYDRFRDQLPGYSFMAHLRHHGFPSPLLDWTTSPYVAAYFAFARAQSDKVAIYAFSEIPQNRKSRGSAQPAIFGLGPYVRTHKRHFRQQSVYTICAQFDKDNGWTFAPHQEVFDLGETDQDLLWKIVLPADQRLKVLIPIRRLADSFRIERSRWRGS